MVGEINTIGNLWTARVASHVPIRDVPSRITFQSVLDVIRLADRTLKDAGYERPVIAVDGLNPHCGDNGLCGDEEITIIRPAIEARKRKEYGSKGPIPPTRLFVGGKRAF